MTVSWILHLWQMLCVTVIAVAPLPLAVGIARRAEQPSEESVAGHRWLVTLVVWACVQTAVGLLLGWVHLFRPWALLGVETVVLAAGWWWSRPRWCVVPRLTNVEAALGLVTLSMGASALVMFLRVPPTNFDSLAYHLPQIVRWLQESHLVVVPELGNAARYPYDWEIVSALFVLPLGEDLLVSAPNLVAWLLLGTAILTMSQRLGATRDHGLVAAVLVMGMPSVLSRIEAIQPDIALAAFFVAAIYFMDCAFRTRSAWCAALGWCCLAMVAGCKLSGLGYAGFALIGTIVPQAIAGRGTDRSSRRAVDSLALPRAAWLPVAALVVLLGGTWYLRNLAFTGNPLGFLRVDLLGTTVLPGDISSADLRPTTLAHVFDPGRGDHWTLLLAIARRWLGLPLLILSIGLPLLLWDLRRRGEGHRICRRLTLTFAFLLMVTAATYWGSPFSADNGEHGGQLTTWVHVGLRYGYPALACLAVLGAAGFTAVGAPMLGLLPLAVVAAAIGVTWGLAVPAWHFRVLVVVGLVAALWATRRSLAWPRSLPAGGLLTGAMFLVATGWIGMERGERSEARARRYGGLDRHLESLPASDAVVGYAGTLRRYPLYGVGLARRVIPVEPSSLGKSEWMRELRQENVQWLVIPTGEHQRSRWDAQERVLRWIAEHPDVFALEYSSETARHDLALYRVTVR